jgi:hypothetical protein
VNIDALLSRAGDELTTAAARELDGADALAALHRTRRRRRTAAVGALVAALAVLAVSVVGSLGLPSARDRGPVQPPPPPRACGPVATTPCAGGGGFEVSESVPFVWTLPADYLTVTHGSGHALTYASAAAWPATADASALTDGVTVLVDASPGDATDPDRAPSDRATGPDAHSLAIWLSGRPFLTSSGVRRTVVGGRPAWELDVTTGRLDAADRVPPRVFGEKEGCGCSVVAVLLRQSTPPAGTPRDWLPIGERSTARIWLVDLPGGHVAAIRATGRSDPAYVQAQTIVDSIRFEVAPG